VSFHFACEDRNRVNFSNISNSSVENNVQWIKSKNSRIHLIRKLNFSQDVSGSQNDNTRENASHT